MWSSCGRGVVVVVVGVGWTLHTERGQKTERERETKCHNISYNMCLAMNLLTCQDFLNVF